MKTCNRFARPLAPEPVEPFVPDTAVGVIMVLVAIALGVLMYFQPFHQ